MRKVLTLLTVLVSCWLSTFAQTKNVTGRVTDPQGSPVPFASVRIKGTKLGVSADGDGNFLIKAKEGDVLLFSGAGIATKEVVVTNVGNAIIVQVSRKESTLSEVV